MRIAKSSPQPNRVLSIVADDGRIGNFDVSPYMEYEALEALQDHTEFLKVFNGGYFVEWDCGADLSADTIGFNGRWLAKQPRRQLPNLSDCEHTVFTIEPEPIPSAGEYRKCR